MLCVFVHDICMLERTATTATPCTSLFKFTIRIGSDRIEEKDYLTFNVFVYMLLISPVR